MFEYIQSSYLSSCSCIKTFVLSTFYTTIHHSKLKDDFKELTQLCLIKKIKNKGMASVNTNILS
jgi:hypothetical protein